MASHTPVTYPFALTRRAGANPQARALLAFLTGPEARPTWQRFGFSNPQ
ncbi:MAG TPA: substrate-binding domain-containing protein [Roseomonas sp.]|nr:substrate-binding domain-containing protein [Roseomonas sp.]